MGGVAFDETIGIDSNFHFYVYSNSTYDKCYEKRDQYNDEAFKHHQTEIQNAVSNAIRRYSMKSTFIHISISQVDIQEGEGVHGRFSYLNILTSHSSQSHQEAITHGYIVPLLGAVYLLFVSISVINEKKNHMIDYLRTMGLLVLVDHWTDK